MLSRLLLLPGARRLPILSPIPRSMGRSRIASALAATALAALITGCASGPQANPDDPLEPMNRVTFKVNDTVDQYVAVPVAKGYKAVTPEPVRQAVTNFYSNLADVGNFANNLLQGKGTAAAETLMRVAINSVLGIGGLIDIATPAGLERHSQDLGLTLGVWGFPQGPYIVLPLFGPSTVRDGIGLAGSFYLDPAHYLDPAWRNSLFALNVVNVRTNLLGATDLLSLAALDKYSFVRDGYLQRRRYLLGQGGDDLPSYDDEDEGTPSDVPKRIKPDTPASPDAPAKPDADGAKPEATPPVPAATPAPAPGMAK